MALTFRDIAESHRKARQKAELEYQEKRKKLESEGITLNRWDSHLDDAEQRLKDFSKIYEYQLDESIDRANRLTDTSEFWDEESLGSYGQHLLELNLKIPHAQNALFQLIDRFGSDVESRRTNAAILLGNDLGVHMLECGILIGQLINLEDKRAAAQTMQKRSDSIVGPSRKIILRICKDHKIPVRKRDLLKMLRAELERNLAAGHYDIKESDKTFRPKIPLDSKLWEYVSHLVPEESKKAGPY